MFSGFSSEESGPPALSPDLCEGEVGDGADGGLCEGGGGSGGLLPVLGACDGVLRIGRVKRGGQRISELFGGVVDGSDADGGRGAPLVLVGVAGGPGLDRCK